MRLRPYSPVTQLPLHRCPNQSQHTSPAATPLPLEDRPLPATPGHRPPARALRIAAQPLLLRDRRPDRRSMTTPQHSTLYLHIPQILGVVLPGIEFLI